MLTTETTWVTFKFSDLNFLIKRNVWLSILNPLSNRKWTKDWLYPCKNNEKGLRDVRATSLQSLGPSPPWTQFLPSQWGKTPNKRSTVERVTDVSSSPVRIHLSTRTWMERRRNRRRGRRRRRVGRPRVCRRSGGGPMSSTSGRRTRGATSSREEAKPVDWITHLLNMDFRPGATIYR